MKTTYIGQFTWEHANALAGEFEQAGITWYYKQSGGIVQTLFRGEWGVRLFVDPERMEEATEIAKKLAQTLSAQGGSTGDHPPEPMAPDP